MNNELCFSRADLLLGSDTMKLMARQRVIVFGVGGVGSWCAEALVRSGIRQLTIVDCDRVSVTNINRQLMATTKTVGQLKVEALRQRLLDINPEAQVTALPHLFTEDTAGSFQLDSYDYIIDCIDSLRHKGHLILAACQTNAVFFSSMGAALKLDPTRIRVTEFWKVEGDPLARALRKRFKHNGQMPAHKFLCVCSDELLPNVGTPPPDDNSDPRLDKPQTNGSLVHITAIFGFMLASLVVRDVKEKAG